MVPALPARSHLVVSWNTRGFGIKSLFPSVSIKVSLAFAFIQTTTSQSQLDYALTSSFHLTLHDYFG